MQVVEANDKIHMPLQQSTAQTFNKVTTLQTTNILTGLMTRPIFYFHYDLLRHTNTEMTATHQYHRQLDTGSVNDAKLPIGKRVVLQGFVYGLPF